MKRPSQLVNLFSSSHCLQLTVASSCFYFTGVFRPTHSCFLGQAPLTHFSLKEFNGSALAFRYEAEKVSRRDKGFNWWVKTETKRPEQVDSCAPFELSRFRGFDGAEDEAIIFQERCTHMDVELYILPLAEASEFVTEELKKRERR